MATNGVLLKKADVGATNATILNTKPLTVFVPRNNWLKTRLITSVFRIMSEMTRSSIITANCSFAKPAKASEGLSTPAIINTVTAMKKETSARSFPL